MSTLRSPHQTVTVTVGQVWESTDPRHKGRRCRVVALEQGPSERFAVLENMVSQRRSHVPTWRMRGRWHWQLVPAESEKAGA